MANENLGASFSIDISNLKAGLNTANKLIRESQSEFKAAAAGLDDWTKSEEGLRSKISSLNSIIGVQEQKVEALKKEYQRLVDDGLDEASDRAIYLRTQINNEQAALEKNKSELNKQTKALEEVENASDDAGDSIEETGEQAKESSGGFTVLKGALANLVADGFRKAINAAKDFAKAIVEVGQTFDSSMSQVGAVSGATAEDLQKLRDKAQEMGSTTKFTASEAADAFNYMAMAGWKTEEMLGGIEGILNLAAASGSDLATTSDIVTDALTAMGYKAKDAGRLADVMAAASSNANTNVEMMGMTFQYAAPIVGALGYSMEDTAVAIGLMANAGIKGEKSGTALRSILTRLSAPPSECAAAMDQLGISITNTDGTMKTLDTVMQDLRKAFANLSQTEQTAIAKSIAGQEAMSGLLAIVNAAPEDFDKLTKAVENSTGAAEKMANTMLDNLGGDMTILKSQIEGVQLTLYKKFEPTLRSAIKWVQNFISKTDWESFGTKAKKAFDKITSVMTSFGKNVLPVVKTALTVFGKALEIVIDNFNWLAPAVMTAITIFKTFKAVMAISTVISAVTAAISGLSAGVSLATKVQVAWNAAISANPIGAIASAVALLTTGIVMLITSMKDVTKEQSHLNEEQQKAVDTAKEVTDAYKEQKTAAAQLAAQEQANINYTEKLWNELQSLADADGKVKEGYEARAQFILGELNEALGTEYKLNGNIIQSYQDIVKSIDDVIQAKKAQIYLDAYEETYRQAIENTAAAEQARATQAQAVANAQQAIIDNQNAMTAAEEKYQKALAEGDRITSQAMFGAIYGYERKALELEKNLKREEDAYNLAADSVQQYYNDVMTYESASQAALEGNTQKTIDILSKYGGGFQTAASTMRLSAEEQKEILGQQVIDTEVNLQLMKADYEKYSGEMTAEEKAQAQQRIENAKKQADDAKKEFQKVGGQITKGMAAGVEGSQWELTEAMQQTIDAAVEAAKKAAGIQSPSKLFRKVIGLMIGKGTALGIIDSTSDVVDAVKQQVRNIEDAYDFNGFASDVNAGVIAKGNTGRTTTIDESKSVVVNQYNTYSQAHSRYEIYKSKQQTLAAVQLAMMGV